MHFMHNGLKRAPQKLSLPLALLAAQLATCNPLQSQTPQSADNAAALPKFDVVSIRPVKDPGKESCPKGSGVMPSGDTFHINCMPLGIIIKFAYGVITDDLISGEPAWAKSSSFDISAKVDPADATAFGKLKLHDLGLMLQPVLQDRFQLSTHYEPRQRTVYTLVLANGGPKLKASAPDPSSTNRPTMKMPRWGEIECRNCAISAMPMLLSQLVGGRVIDQTGLTANYDFTLSYAPDPTRADDTRPSILTAMQEQLGLKFVPKKEPVNVLVIDHVEEPSPN
jgi:uncharacterized protein (TIGR03435 family)